MILCGENRQKTFAQCDEGMSLLKDQMIESFLYLVLISPLNTAISINVVGSKHKAKRQDRKFTWDFYE